MEHDSGAKNCPERTMSDEQTEEGLSLGPTLTAPLVVPVEQGHGPIVRVLSTNESIVRVYWENSSELDVKVKKSTRDKLLTTHKGKFIVDCKKRLEECAIKGPLNDDEMLQTDSNGFIATDAMMIDDNKESIDDFKARIVGLMEKYNFSADYSSINGGESIS